MQQGNQVIFGFLPVLMALNGLASGYDAQQSWVIPGRNCGITRPYKHVDQLPKKAEDQECLILEDEDEYREGHFHKRPGKHFLELSILPTKSLGLSIEPLFF